jgi:hypothetical protein
MALPALNGLNLGQLGRADAGVWRELIWRSLVASTSRVKGATVMRDSHAQDELNLCSLSKAAI